MESIGRSPSRFPQYEGASLTRAAHRARVARFPYYVINRYEPSDEHALVIAVSHSSQRPSY